MANETIKTTYVKSFNGYIADVPKMWFKRCDGSVFYFDELTDASVTPNVEYMDVSAGWSVFPVAQLPGQSTFEMSITTAKFDADLFSMANATKFEEKDFEVPVTETLRIKKSAGADNNADEYYVDLTHDAVAAIADSKFNPGGTSVAIRNMISASAKDGMKSNQFFYEHTPEVKDEDSGNVTKEEVCRVWLGEAMPTEGDIDGYEIAEGQEITVSYRYINKAMVTEVDNKSSAVGEAVLVYPVYAAGDNCTESSIIGHVYMTVYRARFTQMPGLDGSYKSASTYQFTLSAMDAKRPDDACYSIAYIEN